MVKLHMIVGFLYSPSYFVSTVMLITFVEGEYVGIKKKTFVVKHQEIFEEKCIVFLMCVFTYLRSVVCHCQDDSSSLV